jgi:hypothetical protein
VEYQEFKQAKEFIFSDIDREISLAKTSQSEDGKSVLEKAGIPVGGGNFLAALGLLAYTEFFGDLKYKNTGHGSNSKNFNSLFDDLGTDYQSFRASGEDVYKIFRCGLAHEYYTKKDCTIFMLNNGKRSGIGKTPDEKYYFVVEAYFEALKVVINSLESELYK